MNMGRGDRGRTGFEPWEVRWGGDFCLSCIEAAKEAHDKGREDLWRMLPELFGLPKWEDLTDFGEPLEEQEE
jgi:hypothetical protein